MTKCNRCEADATIEVGEVTLYDGSKDHDVWAPDAVERYDLCESCFDSLKTTVAEFMKPLAKEAPKKKRKANGENRGHQ